MKYEDTYDVHRLEADEWDGHRVVTLKDILPFADDKFKTEKWEV